MAYAYQTFTSAAVFTSAQAQQIEDNIRDHRHGVDGVAPSGAAWQTTSQAVAFNLASTDAGKLFKCYGDFNISCATASTLGSGFGAAFKNVGSGRIQINAASGQWIDNNSYYALCPGEGIVLSSDAIELTVIGGQDNAKLFRLVTAASSATIDLTKCFPGDFMTYDLFVQPNLAAEGLVQFRFSIDSGSSFISAGYVNAVGGQTDAMNLSTSNSNSREIIYSKFSFTNGSHVLSMQLMGRSVAISRAGVTVEEYPNYFVCRSITGMINAIRILRDSGTFATESIIEMHGRGRVRR